MFAGCAAVIIWRRPDAVTYPQFWAEDGTYWFADAYNHGFSALLTSVQGYLVTLPRLVAIPAAALSISHAALLFNAVAISVQAAPAAFFVSRRFEHLVSRLWIRALIGLVYVLIPSFELDATLTNSQWHLAILAILVVLAAPAQRLGWRAFDVLVLLLCGLTGPFALLLFPFALARAWLVPSARRWYAGLSGLLLITVLIQGWAALHGHRDVFPPLGATLRNAILMVADRVVLPGSFGEEAHSHVFTQGTAHGSVIAVLVTAIAAVAVGCVLLRGSSTVRIFVLFCFGVTAASLLSPLATGTASAWDTLASSGSADRYFFTAELAWLVCVIWIVSRIPNRAWRRVLAAVLAVAFASGLFSSWSYQAFADDHPAAYNQKLRAAPVGAVVVVPINPNPRWQMDLVRR
jgi:hypothetical protein